MRTEGIARCLQARGHSVTLLCTADHARWSTRSYDDNGIRFIEAPDLWWGRLRSGWDPWGAWHRHRVLGQLDFDLIHSFETRPATIHPLLAALRKRSFPLVIDWCDWWGHGGLSVDNRPTWYPRIFQRLETRYEENYRHLADATTVIAHGLVDRATKLGVVPDSIFWIPNGCRPDDIIPSPPHQYRAEFGLPEDRFILGYSALDVNIGLEFVLSGFARAAAQGGLLLLLMGNAADATAKKAAALGLGNSVRSLGFVSPAAYPRALACADAFLLPFIDRVANYGRWPGRINDYLSLGRPVITQPTGEMHRLLSTEPIGLLSSESPDDLANKILQLRADPKLAAQLGTHARKLAETTLSWSALASQLEAAYAYAQTACTQRTSS